MALFETITSYIGFMTLVIILIAAVGYALYKSLGKRKKRKTIVKSRKQYITFTKRFFKIILINANIWVYLSFILAFMGKQEIAEAISVQAIITIIGVFASYCIKSAYEKKIGKEKEEYEDFNTETYE